MQKTIRTFAPTDSRKTTTYVQSTTTGKSIPHNASDTTMVPMTHNLMIDLQWWKKTLPTWKGSCLISSDDWTNSPDMSLETDASTLGWGAYHQGQWAYAPWTAQE